MTHKEKKSSKNKRLWPLTPRIREIIVTHVHLQGRCQIDNKATPIETCVEVSTFDHIRANLRRSIWQLDAE